MKKAMCLIIMLIVIGCSKNSPCYNSIVENKSVQIKDMTTEEADSMLKDWPFPGANGNWIPSRDGLENCDTIVDGFPYNHI